MPYDIALRQRLDKLNELQLDNYTAKDFHIAMEYLNQTENKLYGSSYQSDALNAIAKSCHDANLRWWLDPATGERRDCNVGELLMLCVSELSEALEGHRKDIQDDKLPHRKMFEVELADCIIRIADIAGALGLDIGGAYAEKMTYNANRQDHTNEARLAPGGKKY